MTGIPAHGGGKRFAVEQELISASSRAAVKNIQINQLQETLAKPNFLPLVILIIGE